MRALLAAAVLALAAGCAAPEPRPLPYDHPANPGAHESDIAPISSTLDLTAADPISPPEAAGAEQ